MRQLVVQVPRGHGQTVISIAANYAGSNLACFEAASNDGPVDMAFVHVSNEKVERLLAELQQLPQLTATLVPRGVIALQPPASDAAEQVTDVGSRSPIEVFLSGLQSVGSWTGFLGYAVAAAFVVWIGLYTNTSYLLTAAMLIAPFAGPAMNTALATARGDWPLLRRTLVRYVAALAVTIGVTGLLSLIFRQRIATPLMVETSQVSTIAALLPLVAGAAGALNLVQSERSSLVSGAAVGLLVAASLAPPAGIVGIGIVLGEWEMVLSAVFVLVLQLTGINLSGALVFRAYNLSARGTRYDRGTRWVVWAALAVTVVGLALLLAIQLWQTPALQRSSRSQRAAAIMQQVVNESGIANPVEINARFTRANIQNQNTLLGVVYVQRRPDTDATAEEIRSRLTGMLQERLLNEHFNVTPLIDVSVLDPPMR